MGYEMDYRFKGLISQEQNDWQLVFENNTVMGENKNDLKVR